MTTSARETILRLEHVTVVFPGPRGGRPLTALNDVELEVTSGDCVAIVGESGSGKSTLARAVLGLQRLHAGRIVLRSPLGDEGDIVLGGPRSPSRSEWARHRSTVQMVFQDPYASLDPRWTIGRSIAEPLRAGGLGTRQERERRVTELLRAVGLSEDLATRHPHELSGGQRQRVGIARALAPRPSLVVLDEATAALDVSIQAQIVNLLLDLQERFSLSLLLIAHDLGIVKTLAHRVFVLQQGRVVESGTPERVFTSPGHGYTQSLIDAIPRIPGSA